MDKISQLAKIIDQSNNIVFLGGAGVSTDSGIRDFRGKNGLYKEAVAKDPNHSPEYLLSSGCLYNEPKKFFENYRKNLDIREAKPNITHLYLKKLEDMGKLKAVVTQNIDCLHQKAGSKTVYEIHGTMSRCYCEECGKKYPGDIIFNTTDIPECKCGGMIRPDVVLYGEFLPEDYSKASYAILKAEVLIVAGTSLKVGSATGLISIYQGKHLIIINDTETACDDLAEIVIHKPLGEVFGYLMEHLKE